MTASAKPENYTTLTDVTPAKQSMRELTRMGGMEPVRWGVLGTSKFAREWIVPA